MHCAIVIPARYGSTRLPGKPLQKIGGKTMLSRVIAIAHAAAAQREQETPVMVATDHEAIVAEAQACGVEAVMTPADCPSGTDRAYAALQGRATMPDYVINLQGDAPLTPVTFVTALLKAVAADPAIQIATPVTQLSWEELDALRESKRHTPFSGTTAIVDAQSQARWFSKTILPAIRDEAVLRRRESCSPVWGHVGLYAYRYDILARYVALPPSPYERLEGLEQLRALENGMAITAVPVRYDGQPRMTGVDSPEDVARVEALLRRYGEP